MGYNRGKNGTEFLLLHCDHQASILSNCCAPYHVRRELYLDGNFSYRDLVFVSFRLEFENFILNFCLPRTNIGGYISDVLLKANYDVPFVRKLSEMVSGFLTLYFFLMVPFCTTKESFALVTFLSAFGNGLNVGGSGAALLGKFFCLFSLIFTYLNFLIDLTTDYVANLTSLINFITLFVGWSTPLIVTGLLQISDGDWTIVFISSSAALFFSSIAFGIFVQPENQNWEFTTFLSTTYPISSRYEISENGEFTLIQEKKNNKTKRNAKMR